MPGRITRVHAMVGAYVQGTTVLAELTLETPRKRGRGVVRTIPIRAPCDGVIIEQHVGEGSRVEGGEALFIISSREDPLLPFARPR
jgi:hypothetical protein